MTFLGFLPGGVSPALVGTVPATAVIAVVEGHRFKKFPRLTLGRQRRLLGVNTIETSTRPPSKSVLTTMVLSSSSKM
jgi:hypothetical protein